MKTWILQMGSVLSAFAASLCCIAPILAISLGIGKTGFMVHKSSAG